MVTLKIKKQLHAYIDMIEDKFQLEMLRDAAKAYAKRKQPDMRNCLTPERLMRFEKSIEQTDKGNLIPHKDFSKTPNK